MASNSDPTKVEKDFWRDSWARYLGYANEVGESFRPIVPRSIVRASYGVAFAYTLADTADKGYKMSQKDCRLKPIAIEVGDALLWQTLASVAIPGYVINRICALTQWVFRKHQKIPRGIVNWMAVGVSLVSVPIIVHPIDSGTTYLMDQTYRRWITKDES